MGNLFAAIYCQSEPCKSDLVAFYNSSACHFFFVAAIYCQSEPCKSDSIVFYNSLACLSHSVGPRDRRPPRIQFASQRHIRSCRGGHNRSQWELVPNLRGLSYATLYNLRFSAAGCVMGVLVTWSARAFDLLIGLLLGPMLLKYVVSSATGDAMA